MLVRWQRELGAIGAKVNALKQKNSVLPETLVAEMVAKYLSFLPRRELQIESESEGQPEDIVNGCILHNFPRCALACVRARAHTRLRSARPHTPVFSHVFRSLEEAKLFERALIAQISDEESRALKLAALESESASGESSDSAFVSQVDTIVNITPVPVPEVAEEATSWPPTASGLGNQESRHSLLVTEKKSPEAQAKAEQEQEALRRKEARAQLEDFWRRTSRYTKVGCGAASVK